MADEDERVVTIPLGKCWTLPRTKRVPGAIRVIKDYVIRHLQSTEEDVWIDPRVNEFLWSRGIQKPPRRIKVRVIKFEDELVEVSLPET